MSKWILAPLALLLLRLAWFLLRRALRRSLKGCAVVVTGCDTGIGLAVARRLAKEEALVFAGCLNEEGMAKCAQLGGTVRPLKMDITNAGEVAAAVDAVQAELKKRGVGLLGLVNNAGIGIYGFAEQLPLEKFYETIEVNCKGTVLVTKSFLGMLRHHGPGARLVTLGSLSGRLPAGFGSAYVPTKAFVTSLTCSLGAELRRFGVSAAVIEPGFIASELLDRGAARGGCSSSGPASEGGSGSDASQRAELHSAYGEFSAFMAGTRQKVEMSEKMNELAGGADWAADSVVDALSSALPRTKYLVGYDAQLLGLVVPRIPGFTRLLGLILETDHRKVHPSSASGKQD